jgi:cytidine deaminase
VTEGHLKPLSLRPSATVPRAAAPRERTRAGAGDLPEIDWTALVRGARQVRKRAYVPYSHFPVGAAVLGGSGKIHLGCNVENASYGLTICAERSAVARAIAAGEKRVLACAISVPGKPCPPCGACRQVLVELGDPGMPLLLAGAKKARTIHLLADLIPHPFDKTYL